jgi:Cu2+-exporting ATPase
MNSCIHCSNSILNRDDEFCCNGCKYAYDLIFSNSLGNYYKFRTQTQDNKKIKPENFDNHLNELNFIENVITNNGLFSTEIMLHNIHCGACIWLIENILKKQNNIESARINFTQKTLLLKWRNDINLINNFVKIIESIGYKATPLNPDLAKELEKKFDNNLFKALAVAGFGAGNIMLFSFALWFHNENEIANATRQILHIFSSLIALPIIIYSGRIFFISAYKAIKNKLPNMDIPISLAIILAGIVSFIQTYRQGANVYFDSAVMLIFFLLIGRYLDHKARKKAFNLATEFMQLQTIYGKVIIDNKIITLPANKIEENMQLIIAVGEKIACDGIVISGESSVDNSIISGESAPQKITKNSIVYGGAINIEAPIEIKVTKNLKNGTLSKIIDLIKNIENSKNKYVRIADKLSKYYTPIVHILAILTFILWYFILKKSWDYALMNATAVLIITCPCALALAVPIVQTITISNFLKYGIIIKNSESLEILNKIKYVIFDKTGSLTQGKPVLSKIYFIKNHDKTKGNLLFEEIKITQDSELIKIASNLAKYSQHPISKALAILNTSNFDFKDPKEHKGYGVEAFYENKLVKLGNAEFCKINNYHEILENENLNSNNAKISNMHCFLNYDDKIFIFTFQDEIKSGAIEAINYLKNQGKNIILLSGDNKYEVKRIANILNIKDYYFEKNPLEKAKILEDLHKKNIDFIMVGDGINDAPSLAMANVSISFNSAIYITQNIADIIINSANLDKIEKLFEYTKKSLKIMQENLILALIYNMLAIPFAVLGYISPLLAALAMSSSSILVILNSIRVNNFNKNYL